MQSANPASKAIDKLLFEHPRTIDESYLEHAGHAGYIGIRLLLSGLACLVHALLPGLFVRTASNTIDSIIALMAQRSGSNKPAKAASTRLIENPSS